MASILYLWQQKLLLQPDNTCYTMRYYTLAAMLMISSIATAQKTATEFVDNVHNISDRTTSK
jgi:hypothetical protein